MAQERLWRGRWEGLGMSHEKKGESKGQGGEGITSCEEGKEGITGDEESYEGMFRFVRFSLLYSKFMTSSRFDLQSSHKIQHFHPRRYRR